MHRIERAILFSFSKQKEQSISQIMDATGMARSTIKKYLSTLVSDGFLEAIGEARERYYIKIRDTKESLSAVYKSGELIALF